MEERREVWREDVHVEEGKLQKGMQERKKKGERWKEKEWEIED